MGTRLHRPFPSTSWMRRARAISMRTGSSQVMRSVNAPSENGAGRLAVYCHRLGARRAGERGQSSRYGPWLVARGGATAPAWHMVARVLSRSRARRPARRWTDPLAGRRQVVDVSTVHEPMYLKAEATRISIFMNVFDVHVNRYPVSGTGGADALQRRPVPARRVREGQPRERADRRWACVAHTARCWCARSPG